MKKSFLFVYDNRKMPEKRLTNIVGQNSFAEIIYKRKSLKKRMMEIIDSNSFVCETFVCSNEQDNVLILNKLLNMENYSVFHIFSYSIVANSENFSLVLNKFLYSNVNLIIQEDDLPLALFFTDALNYRDYLTSNNSSSIVDLKMKFQLMDITTDAIASIYEYYKFINYISGNFEARYFNSVVGTEFTVTKKSTDKSKIKKEYQFYQLLPDEMKSWFILPYDYQECSNYASYTMERYKMTDMAIRWIHNSISLDEFSVFIKKAMRFIMIRSTRQVTEQEAVKIRNNLYQEKLADRLSMLKEHKEFPRLENYILTGVGFQSIDDIFGWYCELYHKMTKKISTDPMLVIGHGDFCFSNILYDRDTSLLRVIDPKGALQESEIWTDPYYDIAKLSHSICGQYDFINNSLFNIELDENLQLQLVVDCNNSQYVQIFKDSLQEYGFQYDLVRLFEASLFLSMLPLHVDHIDKVLGFLLNAVNILKEIERTWKG